MSQITASRNENPDASKSVVIYSKLTSGDLYTGFKKSTA